MGKAAIKQVDPQAEVTGQVTVTMALHAFLEKTKILENRKLQEERIQVESDRHRGQMDEMRTHWKNEAARHQETEKRRKREFEEKMKAKNKKLAE